MYYYYNQLIWNYKTNFFCLNNIVARDSPVKVNNWRIWVWTHSYILQCLYQISHAHMNQITTTFIGNINVFSNLKNMV